MPNYQGVWSLTEVYQAVGEGNWTNDNSIGVFGGGTDGSSTNTIDYILLASGGAATDFGDLTSAIGGLAACASEARGLFGGGSFTNAITYVTFSSKGNSVSFGNLTPAYVGSTPASFSNSTRGIWAGGSDPFVFGGRLNVIGYVTIASTGNATDFGDVTGIVGGVNNVAGTASSTRGLIIGGQDDSTRTNVVTYVTIATTSNSVDFGDLSAATSAAAAASSSVRAVIGGGTTGSTTNTISYLTIATTGNTTDFGDLTSVRENLAACSNKTNAVFGGGFDNGTSTYYNVIDKVIIATTGNADDFGDLTSARRQLAGCSSAHGGLA